VQIVLGGILHVRVAFAVPWLNSKVRDIRDRTGKRHPRSTVTLLVIVASAVEFVRFLFLAPPSFRSVSGASMPT
jgi:hypothetical protein